MSDAFVVGVGAFGPFGLDARQAALVARASKLVPRPTELRDERGFRMGDARAACLPDNLHGVDRMWALATPALSEALDDAGLSKPERPLPLFLSLPEPRADDGPKLGRPFVEVLAEKAPIDLGASSFFRGGSAGFAAALDRARAHVTQKGSPAIVGGVDSYHSRAALVQLDKDKRLLSGEVHDGFVPSEGGVFAVVAATHRGPRFAKVTEAVVAQQPAPTPDDARTGDAMSDLVRRAAQRFPRSELTWVLPDVNGERHRVNEWLVTKVRNEDLFASDALIEDRLVEHVGEPGAAFGALALVYVTMAFRLGFAPFDSALVTLSSEGLDRGAFVLERA